MQRTVPGYMPESAAHVSRDGTGTGTGRARAILTRSIVGISFLFMAFPALDLAVSRRVAQGSVFVLAEHPFLKGLREIGLLGPVGIVAAMLLVLGLYVLLPRRYAFCAPHKPLFVLLSYAAGPGLVVETLKPLIGRARPRHLLEFGGTADFTPVWQLSAACARNCSFPSGEASGAAAALSLLVFVPAKQRWIAAMGLTPVLMMIALNRVLFGAHFLSDVVLGWLLTMLAMAWIWKWADMRAGRIDRLFTRSRP